jgi:hypothetical protein
MAIDFRKPKTQACLTWLRQALADLEAAGVIEATEEKHPPHFHVAVLHQRPEQHIQMAAGDVALPPKNASSTAPKSKKARSTQRPSKQTAASAKHSAGARSAGPDR